jgi:hypothetical protein
MKLPFPVFTRICEPFVRLGYEVKDGHVKRDMYEPTRNDTVVMIDIGLRTAKIGGAPVTIDYIKYVRHYANRYETHILGITKTTLNYVVQHRLYGVAAADTDKPRGSGREKMASRREYCKVFREWLGDYEQPEPEEWLNEVVE